VLLLNLFAEDGAAALAPAGSESLDDYLARIEERAVRDANTEAAAVLGFSSAIGAFGGFFIPMSYGASISMTGTAESALYMFILFYLTCIATTWWYYARRSAPFLV